MNKLSLHAVQTQFCKAVWDGEAEGRLQIYRNNIFITLTETLRLVYPYVEKIVGADFFDAVAARYIQRHVSCIDQFPDFLATFPETISLPYLTEIAQLEWTCYQVFHAPDDTPLFDFTALKNITERQYAEIKFHLHPAVRVMTFQYPVYRIWQLCRQENNSDETIDLAEGGVDLLIRRRDYEVDFHVLSKSEFVLLHALSAEKTFGEACAVALRVEPDFDVSHTLQKHIARGVIAGFVL